MKIDRYFLDEDLGLYAEHGDQFAGSESTSPLKNRAGNDLQEAPGFFFLRYVWNRLELREPNLLHLTLCEALELLTEWVLRKKEGPLDFFCRYISDYFRAVRDLRIPCIEQWLLAALYRVWKAKHPGPKSLALGNGEDDLTEADLEEVRGELSSRASEALGVGGVEPLAVGPREALDEVEEATPHVDWLPGRPAAARNAYVNDEIRGLRRRFTTPSDGFPLLHASKINTVTIGHTHQALQAKLFSDQATSYLNTGSWTRANGTPLYAWASCDGGSRRSGLRTIAAD